MRQVTPLDPELARVRKIGLFVLGATVLLFALVFVASLAWVGFAAYGSETAGVRATYLVSFPLGATALAMLGAAGGHFLVKKSAAAKIAVPVVAGFVGGVGTLAMVLLFFELIFPAL